MTTPKKWITPDQVLSPKEHFSMIAVLRDGGPGGQSVVLCRWDGEVHLATRWNGTDEAPLGSPQARGYATWHVLDEESSKVMVRDPDYLAEDKRLLAANFI